MLRVLYDEELDAFIPPKPFPSWTLDPEAGVWVAPVANPDPDAGYSWDEGSLSWVDPLPDPGYEVE